MPRIVGLHKTGLSVGVLIPTAQDGTVPAGTLLCDGSPVSRTQYKTLFAKIGVTWGIGDGSTTFNLPDIRGMNLRGRDQSAGRDPDKATRSALVAGTHNITGDVTLDESRITGINSTDYANIAPGMSISGTGIPAGSYVRSKVDGDSIEITDSNGNTVVATATNVGVTLTLSNSAVSNFVGSYQDDAFQGHVHNMNIRVSSDDVSGGDTVSGAHDSTQNFRSYFSASSDSIATLGSNGTPKITSESRSKNVAGDWVIVYA